MTRPANFNRSLRSGILEVDFLLAALLLFALASAYLNFAENTVHSSAEARRISQLELNALKASELLKRKCNWDALECAEILAKLNVAVSFSKTNSNASFLQDTVCVRRLLLRNEIISYAEVCAK